MKFKLLLILLAAVALLGPNHLTAQTVTTNRPDSQQDPELKALVDDINAKLKTGQTNEVQLAPELATFDQLLAKHTSEKTDAVAQILYMKAMLYIQVFDNPDKGKVLIQKVKTDYPDTHYGKKADRILANFEKQAESKKIQSGLAPGTPFPDFNQKDLNGNPISVGAFKGKVVMLDFWATWCGPCRAEMPNVIATYKKYHDVGFNIIGVSLDGDRTRLNSFLKKNADLAWPQFFEASADGAPQNWSNELAVKYGVESIPFTILIGPDGKILGTELRGPALGAAVAKALGK